jgi:MFS superfamily sulfate permease-like transporter
LAHLPAQDGLYTAFVGVIPYVIFGTSKGKSPASYLMMLAGILFIGVCF